MNKGSAVIQGNLYCSFINNEHKAPRTDEDVEDKERQHGAESRKPIQTGSKDRERIVRRHLSG